MASETSSGESSETTPERASGESSETAPERASEPVSGTGSEGVSETVPSGIFQPPWHYAAEESDLREGNLYHAETGGKDLLLIIKEEQVYAFSNICPHARCPLDKGKLEEYTLTCLCHGRRFDIRTGECLNDMLELKKLEWKLEAGKIGVKIVE